MPKTAKDILEDYVATLKQSVREKEQLIERFDVALNSIEHRHDVEIIAPLKDISQRVDQLQECVDKICGYLFRESGGNIEKMDASECMREDVLKKQTVDHNDSLQDKGRYNA